MLTITKQQPGPGIAQDSKTITAASRFAILGWALLALCAPASSRGESGETETGMHSARIKVITYNVQFLPGVAAAYNTRKEPEYRARRIAEEVSKFDIVCLEETFHDQHRTQIIEAVHEAWGGEPSVVVSPKPVGRYANGGCLILTRRPIVKSNSMVFEHYSRPQDYGFRADGFAAKGVIHARVARSREELKNTIDVFVTHLEARDDALRPLQYREMAEFIQRESDPAAPALILGDLNTNCRASQHDDPRSQYTMLMRELNGARASGFVDVWPLLRGNELGGTTDQGSSEFGGRIDAILLSNPLGLARQLKPVSTAVNLYQDPRIVALSDHNAVIAEVDWPAK